jgi:enoyl-CoA hydratase/carnithine racemase
MTDLITVESGPERCPGAVRRPGGAPGPALRRRRVTAHNDDTGRVVDATEAVRIGLANRIVPSERLFDEALAMATVIAAHPAAGVRLSKRAIQRNQEITSFAAALELENRGQALLTRTGELPAALAARAGRR